MASPRLILKLAVEKGENPKEEQGESGIVEMIERVFTTRNLAHFAHWRTGSYAAHQALGELYDSLIEDIDDIVETYQGEFGLIKDLCCDEAKFDGDILPRIKDDSNWIKQNRQKIANGSRTIENMIDSLTGTYNKIIYKLENLK